MRHITSFYFVVVTGVEQPKHAASVRVPCTDGTRRLRTEHDVYHRRASVALGAREPDVTGHLVLELGGCSVVQIILWILDRLHGFCMSGWD